MAAGSPTCQNRCRPTAKCWSRFTPPGVNLLDSKIRSGEFKLVLPYRMPLILGNDVAGEVVRVGPGVRRFNVGDEVYARPDKAR